MQQRRGEQARQAGHGQRRDRERTVVAQALQAERDHQQQHEADAAAQGAAEPAPVADALGLGIERCFGHVEVHGSSMAPKRRDARPDFRASASRGVTALARDGDAARPTP